MNDADKAELIYPKGITDDRRANGMTDFGIPLATIWDKSHAEPEDQVARLWVHMLQIGDRYERQFSVG